MVPHLRKIKCSSAVLPKEEGTGGALWVEEEGWVDDRGGVGVCAPLQTHVSQFVLIGDDAAACCSFATNYRLNNQVAAARGGEKKRSNLILV